MNVRRVEFQVCSNSKSSVIWEMRLKGGRCYVEVEVRGSLG